MDVGLVRLVDPAKRPLAGAIVQDHYDLDGPWHHHDMHQIQYAFEGAIELEDRLGRHLLPRSLAGWIPAGVSHRDSMHHVRSVSILLEQRLVPEAGERVRIIRVAPLMREMIAQAVRWPIGGQLDATGQVFFAAFGRLCGEWIGEEAPFTLPSATDPALAAAMAHTRTHLRSVTLPDVCNAAGLSERTLRRRFRSQLGMSWEEYRRRARLMAAAELLTDGKTAIGRIAAEIGFESQSAFAKAFRQFTGETPRRFCSRVVREF